MLSTYIVAETRIVIACTVATPELRLARLLAHLMDAEKRFAGCSVEHFYALRGCLDHFPDSENTFEA